MSSLVVTFIQMVVLILLGIILRKVRMIDERIQQGLSNILVNAVLPFNLISSSQHAYTREMAMGLLAVGGAACCYYTFSILTMRFIAKRTGFSDQEQRVLVMTSVFANTGFVGFPIIQGLFGNQGLLLAACYNMMYNVFMYSYGEHKLSGKKASFKNVVVNPVTLATIASLILFIIPWRMPETVKTSIDLVGNMTVPMAMIIVGSTLATIDVKKLFVDKISYLSTAMRLIVFPTVMLIAVIIVRQFAYMMPVTASTIVLMTALPCGSINVIFCEKYNCAPKLCARNFAQTVALMCITIPIFLGLCTSIFGS